MHVLIDAMAARLGGNITLLTNLLAALLEADGGIHRYTVLGRENQRAQFAEHPRVCYRASPLAEWNTLARLSWEQLAIPAQSALSDIDLVLAPSGLAIFASPRPQILIFQNALPFERALWSVLSKKERMRLEALRLLGIASARAADRVMFISQAQRDLLMPALGISLERTRTIYPGRNSSFTPAARAQSPALCARLGIAPPYLLSVSHFYSYKNIVELVRGFAIARPKLPEKMRLVLAGAEHERDYSLRVREAVRTAGLGGGVGDVGGVGCVDFVGAIGYADLPALYAGAAACVFPSQCESFPNILIEGMASGVPTLSSSAGPMPELARSGALYFNGQDPASIAESMVRLFQDPKLAEEIAREGMVQAARFSWDQTAREMLALFAELSAERSTKLFTKPSGPASKKPIASATRAGPIGETRYAKTELSERRDILRRWLEGRTAGVLIDVGCGEGQLAKVARELGWRVVALDLKREMLRAARESGQPILASADAAHLPLRAGCADALLCMSTLEYVVHPTRAIAEFARCLKPGGSLFISIPNRASALRRAENLLAGLRKRRLLPDRLSSRLSHREYLDYARSNLSDGELVDLLHLDGFELEGLGHFTPAGMPGSGLSIAGMNTYATAKRGRTQ